MANEATKKDLADLEKRVNKAFEAETAENNKIIEGVNKAIVTLDNNIAAIHKTIAELTTAVNQHAKIIDDLRK